MLVPGRIHVAGWKWNSIEIRCILSGRPLASARGAMAAADHGGGHRGKNRRQGRLGMIR